MTVEPDGTTVQATEGEYILTALNRSGYGYRTGCRRGGCGICVADVLAGSIDYPVTVADSVLPQQDRAAGACLTCRAIPRGHVVIKLRNDKLRCTSTYLAALAARSTTPSERNT